jgi:hypothetical protein
MTNHIVSVDFFGTGVRCETGQNQVSLTDLFKAGNGWRLNNGMSAAQLAPFLNNAATKAYIAAAAVEWGLQPEDMLKIVRGSKNALSRTMAHLAVAVFAAEYLSPQFHARMHKELIEGRLMQWRNQGGTEFAQLNTAIDINLPGREDKDSNLGIYIQMAKLIRAKITKVADPELNVWDTAAAFQQQQRAMMETFLVDSLNHGLVRDYAHLKELASNYVLRLPQI